MEDPSEEEYWEIQEYSSSSSSSQGSKTKCSKVSWILDKGLNLGRKIVITGIVISSAPLVLPPLVVISALGFAFSVPFGLVFASYACTQKLMNKLLPNPISSSPSVMLENGTVLFEEEEEEDPVLCSVDEKVKDKGYEEDVGEYLEGEDEEEGPLEGKIDVKIEGMVEAEEEEDEPLPIERSKGPLPEQPLDKDKVDQVVVSVEKDRKNASVELDLGVTRGVEEERGDKRLVNTYNEEEDLARESTRLLEKIRDEGGDVGNHVQRGEMCEIAKEIIDEKNFITNVEVEEMDKPLIEETSSMKVEKLIREMKGAEDDKRHDEVPKENKEIIQERRTQENVEMEPGGMNTMIQQGNRDEKNVDNIVVVEKRIGNLNGSINGKTLLREAGDKYSCTVYEKPKPEEPEGSAEEIGVSVEVHDEIKHAGIDSKRNTPMPVSKVLLNEEKIWEHIDALRTIVGYKAAPHATCLEELKALYIFTGVEPPEPAASFKNHPSDLVEVNDELQFLMSIVGVK